MAGLALSSVLSTLIGRFSNDVVHEQVNLDSKFLGSGALKRVDRTGGGNDVINIVAGASGATKSLAGGGTLPTAQALTFSQGRPTPKNIVTLLGIDADTEVVGRGNKESIDLLKKQMELGVKDLARWVGRSLFNAQLASPDAAGVWSGTAVGSTITLNFHDVSGFRQGSNVDYVSGSNTFSVATGQIVRTPVSSSSQFVGGQVTFTANESLSNLTVATGNQFWLHGATTLGSANGSALSSYVDFAGTGSLHGLAGSLAGWQGNLASTFGSFSQEKLLQFSMQVASISGEDPTHYVCNPGLAAVYAMAAISAGPAAVGGFGADKAGVGTLKNIDGKFDKYGGGSGMSGMTVLGKPLILDNNCPIQDFILHNDNHVKLVVYRDFGPRKQGGDSYLVSQTVLGSTVQLMGTMEMECDVRNSVGRANGIIGA